MERKRKGQRDRKNRLSETEGDLRVTELEKQSGRE